MLHDIRSVGQVKCLTSSGASLCFEIDQGGTMKLRSALALILFVGSIVPLHAETDVNALRREVSHIEHAGDELMRLALDIEDRTLRRRVVERIDEIYEAAERMRLLVDKDTTPKPIREGDLEEFLASLENASFGDAKVAMIEEFVRSNWFTVEQVGMIVEELPFGENKVEGILVLYYHIVDKENAYRLYEFVTFSDDRELLKKGLKEMEAE